MALLPFYSILFQLASVDDGRWIEYIANTIYHNVNRIEEKEEEEEAKRTIIYWFS